MRTLWLPSVAVICIGLMLSACDPDHNYKHPDDFRPDIAISNSISDNEDSAKLYEGTGEVTRYGCRHTGKLSLLVEEQGNAFVLSVTTPSVGSNCESNGDFETARVYGSFDPVDRYIHFSRCNVSEIPPQGLGNYTLKKATGTVSCYNKGLGGSPQEKWLSVLFDLPRIIDGKPVE